MITTVGSFTHPRKWTKTDIFGVHHISCPLEKQKQRACLEDNPSPSPWETGSVSYTPQQPWFLSLFQSLESPRDIILILPTSRRMSARVPATGFVNQRKAHPSHVQDVLETRHVQHSTTTTTTTHEPFPIKISTTMPPTCVGVQSYKLTTTTTRIFVRPRTVVVQSRLQGPGTRFGSQQCWHAMEMIGTEMQIW